MFACTDSFDDRSSFIEFAEADVIALVEREGSERERSGVAEGVGGEGWERAIGGVWGGKGKV